MFQIRLGLYVRRSHNDSSVAEIEIHERGYLSTVGAHEQTTWSAIFVNMRVVWKDFTNAAIIEDKSQAPVTVLRLEDSAFTPGDEVEEQVSDKGNALAWTIVSYAN